MKYKFTAQEANKVSKFGIDLVVYGIEVPGANVVRVSVKNGHLEEFHHLTSTFMYSIVSGKGTFVLNDEKVEAEAGDLLVIPPKTRIHYFGNMEIVLITSPAWREDQERHVRFVDESESPYYQGEK